jgi:hypothetical protein
MIQPASIPIASADRDQTLGEEMANAISHGLGTLLVSVQFSHLDSS